MCVRQRGIRTPAVQVAYFTLSTVDSFERHMDEAQHAMGLDPKHFVPINYINETPILSIIANFAPTLLFIGALLYMSRRAVAQAGGGGPGGIFGVGRSTAKMITPETVKVKFEDVAGMDEAKQEIMEFVNFLKNPKVRMRKQPRVARVWV